MVTGGPAQGDLTTSASAAVDAEVAITLRMRTRDDDAVSIMFGNERITLEFYDVDSLERLRDLADKGAQLLRAATETNANATLAEEAAADDAARDTADQPGNLVANGVR